jgi:hypothetical protein
VLTGGLRFLNQKPTVGARATYTSRAFIAVINATAPANPYTPGYALVDLVKQRQRSHWSQRQ